MDLSNLTRLAKITLATSATGLVVLSASAPAFAQDPGAQNAAQLEGLTREEKLERLGVQNPDEFQGPVSRLVPSRDGSVDSTYERQAAATLRGQGPGSEARAQATGDVSAGTRSDAADDGPANTSADRDDEGDRSDRAPNRLPTGLLEDLARVLGLQALL